MAETSTSQPKSMDAIMALCKRRGFIYQASEIYGGINGFWDYGPLGAQLKKNLRDAWWQDVVMLPCWGQKGPDGERVRTVPLDSTIIQHPKVWEASGHIAGFNDPMVDDKETKRRFRADKVWVVGFFTAEDFAEREAAISAMGAMVEADKEFVAAFDRLKATARRAEGGYVVSTELWAVVEALLGRSKDMSADILPGLPKALVPTFAVSVESDSMEDALLQAFDTLTKRQLERLGTEWRAAASPVTKLMPGLPLLSPATQRETLTQPRPFNLMFKTYIGATATEDDVAYLRPETAQGIFVQFKNVVDTTRVKIPFGIAQTGKAFRNEVTPRNFTFRSREFEQMEIEFFCHPSEARDWYAFWRDWRMAWWESIGLKGDNLLLREHERDELAHYAKEGAGTSDIEYRFPFTAPGFGELEGIAHRTDFDLRQHAQHSGLGDKLKYFDQSRGELGASGQPKGEHYFPHVIEPSAGLDRGVLAILCEAYSRDESRPSPEIMRFHPRMAPIKAAVFPLVNKDGMPEIADRLHTELVQKFGRTGGGGFIETDAKQSIGKRYARMDEAGCPFCFTIDGQTLTDQTVTVRDRDTGAQERLAIDAVARFLADRLGL